MCSLYTSILPSIILTHNHLAKPGQNFVEFFPENCAKKNAPQERVQRSVKERVTSLTQIAARRNRWQGSHRRCLAAPLVLPLLVATKTHTPVRVSAIPQRRLRVEVRQGVRGELDMGNSAGRGPNLARQERNLAGAHVWPGTESRSGGGFRGGASPDGRGIGGGNSRLPVQRGKALAASNRRTVGQGFARAARPSVGVFRGGKPLPGGRPE